MKAKDVEDGLVEAKIMVKFGKEQERAQQIHTTEEKQNLYWTGKRGNTGGAKDRCWNSGGGRYANQCPKGNGKVAKSTVATKAKVDSTVWRNHGALSHQ